MQCSEKVQKPQQLHLRLYRPLQTYYNSQKNTEQVWLARKNYHEKSLQHDTLLKLLYRWDNTQCYLQCYAKCHINMLLVGWWFGFVLEPQELNTSQSWRPWTQGEAICLTVKAGLNPISANLQRSSLKSKESTCCGGPRSRSQLKCCAWINPHKSKLTETI